MKNVLIFVPGIMGSCLHFTYSSFLKRRRIDLWSEEIYSSLKALSDNPGVFKFSPNTKIQVGGIIKFLKLPLGVYSLDVYHSMTKALGGMDSYQLYEFPYDWRQDIFDSAEQLQSLCQKLLKEKGPHTKFSFAGHSMGGLVISTALLGDLRLTKQTDRVVTIGTPFRGSPGAFRGLFTTGYIPGIRLMSLAVNLRRNRDRCKESLIDSCQSFPSIYQLMPHSSHDFVELSNGRMINPLSSPQLKNTMAVNGAVALHRAMAELVEFKNDNPHIAFRHIADFGHDTDYFYSANVDQTGTGFCDIQAFKSMPGDGTVPLDFAEADFVEDQIVRYVGSSHMTMCSDQRIIDATITFL